MRIQASIFAGIRQGRGGWRAAIWVLLFAFSLQSFVTQIHVHYPLHDAGGASIVKTLAKVGGKSPVEKDTGCPYCQAIAHAGAFFTPVTPVLLLPVVWVNSVVLHVITRAIDSISTHHWRSRAPPRS
jgi:hypothetical protein